MTIQQGYVSGAYLVCCVEAVVADVRAFAMTEEVKGNNVNPAYGRESGY